MQVYTYPLQRIKTLATDVANGFFEILHNGLALLGVAVVALMILIANRPDIRQSMQDRVVQWVAFHHLIPQSDSLTGGARSDASERATAANPHELPKPQAAVAFWLSKKYRVAPEPISALVNESYLLSAKANIEPTLILAVMAIESGFNPFAQSQMGAQGLMQVLTRVHTDKYENFGGNFAAFDPLTNLKVGVKILRECIEKAGSVEGGLRYYVGAANLLDDGGYADKVLAEHERLKLVAQGKRVDPQMVVTLEAPAKNDATPAPNLGALPTNLPSKPGTANLLAMGL
jgi:hypothetical protein